MAGLQRRRLGRRGLCCPKDASGISCCRAAYSSQVRQSAQLNLRASYKSKRSPGQLLHLRKVSLQTLYLLLNRFHGFFAPLEVFQLSFTCKTLNTVVCELGDAHWRRLRRVFLPCRVLDPPDGMSERQYLWFLVSTECVNCEKEGVICWTFKQRICSDCLLEITGSRNFFDYMYAPYHAEDVASRNHEMQLQQAAVSRLTEKVKQLADLRGWNMNVLESVPRYNSLIERHAALMNPHLKELEEYFEQGERFEMSDSLLSL